MNPIEVLYRLVLDWAQMFSLVSKDQTFRAVEEHCSSRGQPFSDVSQKASLGCTHTNDRDVFCRREGKTVQQLSEWSVGKDTCHTKLATSVQFLEPGVEGENRLNRVVLWPPRISHTTHRHHARTHTQY